MTIGAATMGPGNLFMAPSITITATMATGIVAITTVIDSLPVVIAAVSDRR